MIHASPGWHPFPLIDCSVARIAGVAIPRDKRVEVALTYIYGIGRHSASKLVQGLNIDPAKKVDSLAEEEISQLRTTITQEYKVEGDLRREINQNIRRLIDIGCYRGLRHRRGLPVRGQRTHCNARTRKGKAIAIAGKKLTPMKK